MPDRKEILSELNAISPELANIPFKPVFTVPGGYFDNFPSKMLEIVKKQEKSEVRDEMESISPLLASLAKKNPLTVPEGYFERLEDQLMIPGGNTAGSRTKLTVPEGLIPDQQATAKVVSMQRTNRFRFMYAAAAVVALLGIFTWIFVLDSQDKITNTGIATVNISSELPKLSASEMTKYLESVPEDLNLEPLSLAGVEEVDIDAIMDGIHESELQQFINENPGLTEQNIN